MLPGGWLTPGTLTTYLGPTLSAAGLALQPGEQTVVEVSGGVHLLHCIAREEGDREEMRRQAELASELAEPGSELAGAAERLIREAVESP